MDHSRYPALLQRWFISRGGHHRTVATVVEVDIERAEIVREALEWQGTHFQHRQQLKGVGCDCVTLLAAIFGAVLDTQPILPAYQPDEWLHDAVERYAEALRVYFDELGRTPPVPGDVVSFHFGRRQVSHCGVCVDTDGGFVSATLESGRVEYGRLSEQYWARRWTGTWRLKRWAAEAISDPVNYPALKDGACA